MYVNTKPGLCADSVSYQASIKDRLLYKTLQYCRFSWQSADFHIGLARLDVYSSPKNPTEDKTPHGHAGHIAISP